MSPDHTLAMFAELPSDPLQRTAMLDQMRRFINEANAMKRFDHPHVRGLAGKGSRKPSSPRPKHRFTAIRYSPIKVIKLEKPLF